MDSVVAIHFVAVCRNNVECDTLNSKHGGNIKKHGFILILNTPINVIF